jgi:hypothetical protein
MKSCALFYFVKLNEFYTSKRAQQNNAESERNVPERHSGLFLGITKESSGKKVVFQEDLLILVLLTCSLPSDVIRGYHPTELGDTEWLTKFGRRMDGPSEYITIIHMTEKPR